MKEKIEKLIKKENLTAGKLAEMLEIQPAVVSHMRAGRNKPSFDLIQKILRRFPQINPDWLLLDSDKMYRKGYNEPGNDDQPSDANLFSAFESDEQRGNSVDPTTANDTRNSTSRESNILEHQSGRSEISDSRNGAKIERVIVFYSDGTFRNYDKR